MEPGKEWWSPRVGLHGEVRWDEDGEGGVGLPAEVLPKQRGRFVPLSEAELGTRAEKRCSHVGSNCALKVYQRN